MLNELQEARCFYCSRPLRRNAAHVDHFIAWSRYPVDLGHNFVLAHQGCNSAKADHLAAVDYLSKWSERNREFGAELGEEFDRVNVAHDLSVSTRITLWAYEQADAAGGLTWVKGKALVPLESDWEHALRKGLIPKRRNYPLAAGSSGNGFRTKLIDCRSCEPDWRSSR